MKLRPIFHLLLGGMIYSCGGSSNCPSSADGTSTAEDSACTSSIASEKDLALGDRCDTNGQWLSLKLSGSVIAAKCVDRVLGGQKNQKLACSREGYQATVSSEGDFAYCVDQDKNYSFLYDKDFGSYKPWFCSSLVPLLVNAVDSSGNEMKLACKDGILKPKVAGTSGAGNETTTTEPAVCKAKDAAEDTFALAAMKLEDFDPSSDQVETFDPSTFCDAPADGTSAVPADNVSGSFIRR